MPLMDAYIPSGALLARAEAKLIERLTDLLLEHEGVDRSNETGRHLAWVFVHRPDVYVGASRPTSPRYRFILQVPEGQYDDERRAAVTDEITKAVIEAEDGARPHPELRVVTFTCEVPDGWWSGGSMVLRLPDIYELIWPLVPGAPGEPRETARRVLADSRRRRAEEILAATGEPSRGGATA